MADTEVTQLFKSQPRVTPGIDPVRGLPRILLVDDEPILLQALSRNLRSYFSITTAEGGEPALEIVASSEPFAVIVTDMRMPGIDGVGVLRSTRESHPDTVRMLLTGYADMDSAIAAVNDGNVFRFLTKPTSVVQVKSALSDGVEQFRLVNAERELLEGTLRGAIGALMETLSLADPGAFSRASRIQGIASELLEALAIPDRWEIEVASMLSQVGSVTLPSSVIDKINRGARLNDSEAAMVQRLPEIASSVVGTIPRLEGVQELLAALKDWTQVDAPLGTRLIQLATEIEKHESRGLGFEAIVAALRPHGKDYGEDLMQAFERMRTAETNTNVIEVPLADLVVGMTLASDVYTDEGALLVGRGQSITDSLLRRLQNFSETGSLTQEEFLVLE
jgi:CheY-like chemotaxis protein